MRNNLANKIQKQTGCQTKVRRPAKGKAVAVPGRTRTAVVARSARRSLEPRVEAGAKSRALLDKAEVAAKQQVFLNRGDKASKGNKATAGKADEASVLPLKTVTIETAEALDELALPEGEAWSELAFPPIDEGGDLAEVADLADAPELAEAVDLVGPEGPDSERPTVHAEPATILTTYFRDLSHYRVLTADEERRAVDMLVELEIQLWEDIFSHPAAVESVLDAIDRVEADPLEGSLAALTDDFRALRRLSRRAISQSVRQSARQPVRPGKGGTHAAAKGTGVRPETLAAAARKLAERMRTFDRDHRYAEHVLAYLNSPPRTVASKLRGAGFVPYLRRVNRKSREVRAARNAFIHANLRLVVAIARRYRRDLLSFGDLIQEGNIGLMKGLARFDHRRGVKFSTYASWWIRHSINRALADKGRAVRLPVHLLDARSRVAKAEHTLDAKLGHRATLEEISAETKIPMEKIEKVRVHARDRLVSFDRPLDSDDDRDLLEIFTDHGKEGPSAAEELADRQMNDAVSQVMADVLKPMEASILRWRFGFEADHSYTLREIGDKYDLSRERIRQIEAQALLKLRQEMTRRNLD